MHDAANLFDIEALRVIETRATQRVDDPFELMRRAGQAAWREVLRLWPAATRILVVCGPGNNGGDGYVLALNAHTAGRAVSVVRPAGPEPRGALVERALAEYRDAGGDVVAFDAALPAADLVVDGLFGIGLSRAPDPASASLIEAINRASVPVFALDVPSGVDAASGACPGAAVWATHTLEFIAAKAGLRTGPALDRTGGLALAALGTQDADFQGVVARAENWGESRLVHGMPQRLRDSHKGSNGRVLCIGGDMGHGGALMLTAEAALRSGAGLVDAMTRGAHIGAMLARCPEVMACAVEDSPAAALRDGMSEADVIAVGPGLGRGEWGRCLWTMAMSAGRPLVMDADALNLLAETPQPVDAGTILTPHPGEAARLLATNIAVIQADRFGAARRLCDRFDCVVVLKGAGSIVAAPGCTPRLIAAGNAGMAVGGMGDVLTGVIAALRGQGLPAFDAAAYGALLHAVAGDRAADEGGQRGLLPSDLMPWLRRCANPEVPA